MGIPTSPTISLLLQLPVYFTMVLLHLAELLFVPSTLALHFSLIFSLETLRLGSAGAFLDDLSVELNRGGGIPNLAVLVDNLILNVKRDFPLQG